MELQFQAPQRTRTSGSGGSGELINLAKLVKAATMEAGGTDELPGGGWVHPKLMGDEAEFMHYDDRRNASTLGWRIRNAGNQLKPLVEVAGDDGYFDATTENDGEFHGTTVKDYTKPDQPTKQATGAWVLIRFVDAASDAYSAEDADAFKSPTYVRRRDAKPTPAQAKAAALAETEAKRAS